MSTAPTPVAIKPYRAIMGVAVGGASGSLSSSNPGLIQTTVNTQTTTLIADAVIEEKHEDEMIITEHPVEVGSTIADHAYAMPAKLELTYSWAEGSPQNASKDLSFLKNLYQQFLGLQKSATLCTVNTGKRIYKNMLMRSVATTSDRENENSLTIVVLLQEILMATTQIVPLTTAAQQALPGQTAPVVNQGNVSLQQAPTFNPGALP